MNRAIAAVYAISIRHKDAPPLNDADKQALIDCIPALIEQVKRLDKLLEDPLIAGYLEARRRGFFLVERCV